MSGELHAPAPPYLRVKTTVSSGEGMGGSQSRSGSGGEDERIPAPVGNRTPVVEPAA